MFVISGPDGVSNNFSDLNEIDKLFDLLHDYHYVQQIMEGDPIAYVQFCQRMYCDKNYKGLAHQYKYLSAFYCILTMEHRCMLLKMFDSVRDFHSQIQISLEMYTFNAYIHNEVSEERLLIMCLDLGEFFIEYALFNNAIAFLQFAEYLCNIVDNVELKLRVLNNFLYLDAILHQYKMHSQLTLAYHNVVSKADYKIQKVLSTLKAPVDLAHINSNYSLLHFTMGRYDLAYQYAISAVECLTATMDLDVAVQIFTQAAKAFLVNQFGLKGKFFLDCAIGLAQDIYCCQYRNPKMAKVFAVYGFFFKKVERYEGSIECYREAINIYSSVFAIKNLYIFMLEADLVESETEGGIHSCGNLRLVERASLYMARYLPMEYADNSKMFLINNDLVKALLLLKLYDKSNPRDINTRKLRHMQIILKRSERIIAEYCGVTSSLYTKYLIVITNVYFAVGKYKDAIEKSKSILDKYQYFSINRNLHEAVVKAEMACTVIRWCEVEDYRKEVIEATLALENSVASIMERVIYDDCPELKKYLQALKDVYPKIAKIEIVKPDTSPLPTIRNKYSIYELHLIRWNRAWHHNFRKKFTGYLGDISTVEKIIEQVTVLEPTI